ncbi:MAG: hypothetical protein B7Y89_12360 [Novosphingobium sp. 32-60-15]|uniref:hypothetical protein n=1 Tax=unclassified Novosphingobium TaxID=2644732 RepID=UPI000BC548E6|nr:MULTISPECIES: hypothetical protein [unclassified Novosphingobium]OYX61698.1 MAG: hypothetical protein B7Y89_12360 [Novosphingobium sp. 32-60-15]
MTASISMDDAREHFAHCVQVLGGVTTASRRLNIDERAIRRFVSGERPVSVGLLQDTAAALGLVIAEATAAEKEIAGVTLIDETHA